MKVFLTFSSAMFFKTSKFCRFLIALIFVLFLKAGCMDDIGYIKQLASSYFSDIPGISNVCANNGLGHIFELEVGFLVSRVLQGQEVVGFSLFFDFFSTHVLFPFKEASLIPESVDYDVISTNYVIECKNCINNSSAVGQFEKEVKMLSFFRYLYQNIIDGYVKIESFINKKGKSLFKINSNHQTIVFSCSWIVEETNKNALKHLMKIFSMLSEKSLLIFVRQPVSVEVGDLLIEKGFDFYDSVALF